MSNLAPNRMRTLLWLCMLMLGLQFCVPSSLHAASFRSTVDELSLRSSDPEAPEHGPEFDGDVALLRSWGLLFHAPSMLVATVGRPADDDDRVARSLIPVVGIQPSAP